MHPQYGIGRIVADRRRRARTARAGSRSPSAASGRSSWPSRRSGRSAGRIGRPCVDVDRRRDSHRVPSRRSSRDRIVNLQRVRATLSGWTCDIRSWIEEELACHAWESTSTTSPRSGRPAGDASPTRSGRPCWPSSAGPTGSRSISARTAGTSRTATCACSARRSQVRLNLELSVEPEIVAIALEVRPDQVTLVPERRAELTTEGGLDVVGQRRRVAEAVARLPRRGARGQPVHRPRPGAGRGVASRWARRPSSCTPGATPTRPTRPTARRELGALPIAGGRGRRRRAGAARRPRAELPERRPGRRDRRRWPS